MTVSPRIKVFGAITGIVSLPAVLFFIFFLVKGNSGAYTQGERLVHERAISLEARLESMLSSRIAVLDEVGRNVVDVSQDNMLRSQIIQHFLDGHREVTNIALTDAHGKEVIQKNTVINSKIALTDRSHNIEFLTVKDKGYYLGPVYISQDKPVFLIGRVIPSSDGKSMRGAVFTLLKADIFLNELKQATTKQGTLAFIVNEKGTTMMHPTLSYVAEAKDFSHNPAVQLAMSNDPTPARTYKNDITENVVGSGVPLAFVSDTGVFLTNWFVIVETPASVAFATAANGRGLATSALLSLLVVSGGVSFIILRRLYGPLEEINRAMDELSSGNTEYRVPSAYTYEGKKIALSMNVLGVRMKQIHDDLVREGHALSMERKKLSLALSHISDAVIACNRKGDIMFANKPIEELTGCPGSVLAGRYIDDVIRLCEDGKPVSIHAYYAYAKENNLTSLERSRALRLISAHNQERLVSVRLGLLAPKESLEHTGYMLAIRDVSREGFLEKVKSDFVAITAHELRTPLTEVKWATSLVLGKGLGILSAKQKNILKRSRESTEHMIDLVDDLLETASREIQQFRCEKTPQDLKKIVAYIVEMHQEEAKQKGIILAMKHGRGRMPLVAIDDGAMKIAVDNLIENAINYTPRGGNVHVSLARVNEGVEMRVVDTGIGVLPEDTDHVFIKFFRGKNAIKMLTEGNGLGLYITKRIVEAHGGRTWVEPHTDNGSTFGINLPVA